MSQDEKQIADAAERCLESAIKAESPQVAVTDVIEVLKDGRTWSERELAEVRRRVLEKLGQRTVDKP